MPFHRYKPAAGIELSGWETPRGWSGLVRGGIGFGCAALALATLATLATGSSGSSGAQGARTQVSASDAPTLAGAVWREVLRSGPERARAVVTALRRGDEEFEFERRVLRIGTALPAGMPAGRYAQRNEARLPDREALARALAPDAPERERWIAWLGSELAREPGERADQIDARRWMAAAGVAATFELYDLAPDVARGLAHDRPPWLRAAARSALYSLCRRRFPDAASFQAFWERQGGGPRDSFFLEALDASERERRDLLERWLASEPAAALERLSDADPVTRRVAAKTVGAAIAAGRLEPDQAVPALLARLAGEPVADTFAALVEAAIDPLLGEPADSEPVAQLRDALAAAIDAGLPGVEIVVARALGRLPWRVDGAPAAGPVSGAGATGATGATGANGGLGESAVDAARAPEGGPQPLAAGSPDAGDPAEPRRSSQSSIGHGLELVARLVERLPKSGPFHDVDVTLAALHALEGLGQRASAPATPRAEAAAGALAPTADAQACERGVARARAVLGPWIQDQELGVGERIAAVWALTPIAAASDLDELLNAFEQAEPWPDLRFALLGSIGHVVEGIAAEGQPEGQFEGLFGSLVERVAPSLADPNPDLRRQTLALLAKPVLVRAAGRSGLDRWIARLDAESLPDLRDELLQLVRANGAASEVRPLLALEHFDDLYRGDLRRTAALGTALVELCAGSAQLTLDAARRFAADPDPTTLDARRRVALALVARLSDDEARVLEPEVHATIVSWAFGLCRAGLGVREKLADGTLLVQRLLDLHEPASQQAAVAGAPDWQEARTAHVRGVLEAELVLRGGSPDVEATAESSFARALAVCEDDGELSGGSESERAAELLEILVDRARYRAALGALPGARADYLHAARLAGILTANSQEPGSAPGLARKALTLADLRGAAGFFVDPVAGPSEPATACELAWSLVHDERWTAELRTTRIEDLQRLGRYAHATGQREPLERFAALFSGLEGDLQTPARDGDAGAESPREPAETRAPLPGIADLAGPQGLAAELRELSSQARTWIAELDEAAQANTESLAPRGASLEDAPRLERP